MAVTTDTATKTVLTTTDQSAKSTNGSLGNHRQPLKLQGALDNFEHFDVTPIIGREYPKVDLKQWLESPHCDDLLRDLAITSKFVRLGPIK